MDEETNYDEHERMREFLKDERGIYAEDESDSDLSNPGEGTTIVEFLGSAACQADNNGTLERPEPIPERGEGVGMEPEDDSDLRDFQTDGTLDLVEGPNKNSDNLLLSDSYDEDYDVQVAPAASRMREVHPGVVENTPGVGGTGGIMCSGTAS